MIPGIRLSRLLLTSASLMTLSLAGVARASAASGITITVTGHHAYTVPTDEGWVNVHASDISTFTNDKNIKDGFANTDGSLTSSLALHVQATSTIATLVNDLHGHVTAIEGTASANNLSTENATATGMLINGHVPSVVNDGSIRAVAVAHDSNDSSVDAHANAVGYRYSRVGGDAINDLVNNGTIAAHAIAVGVNPTGSSAFARAKAVGVSQVASHTGAGGDKSAVALHNMGTVRAIATGSAHGTGGTSAEARATAFAVHQSAANAATASAFLANSGSILATANARAFANESHAYASSAIADAIRQLVSGNGASASATAKVVNDHLVSAVANATAKFTGTGVGKAVAIAQASGVDQHVGNAGVAEGSAQNTGSIFATANAKATSSGTEALAHGSALALQQSISGDKMATALVQNSGSIIATASVKANGRNHTHAFATYVVAGAIIQDANGNGTLGSSATARLVNSKIIKAVANATAQVSGSATDTEEARAGAVAEGVLQVASNAASARNIVQNSGSIVAIANAHAGVAHNSHSGSSPFVATYADAFAFGVEQIVPGGENGTLASDYLTNSGTIKVVATASSEGPGPEGESLAFASAAGVGQFADAGKHAGQERTRLINSNLISAEATATAKTRNRAQAGAFAFGVGQDAFNTYATGTSVSARAWAKNSGAIKAISRAHAQATGIGTAEAAAVGAFQRASNAVVAKTTFVNSGMVVVQASATADPAGFGSIVSRRAGGTNALFHANARATYVSGVHQSATGDNKTGTLALDTLTNGGSILVTARAKAVAGSASFAHVFATVERAGGVRQFADEAETAVAKLVNRGSILVTGSAQALAPAGNSARAEAHSVVGASQGAFGLAGGTAKVRMVNTGVVRASAVALATAMNPSASYTADATAQAIGVHQRVGSAGVGLDNLINSGHISAKAEATAKRKFGAIADANAVGASQNLADSLTGSATARLRNGEGASIFAHAIARAVGAGGGAVHATAAASGFVVKDEPISIPITLDVVNSGLIKAVATATASGVAGASAHAHARGILVTTDGTLAGSITNNGTIDANAIVHAAHGSATAVGIDDPSSGNNGHIINNGSITAKAEGGAGAILRATGIRVELPNSTIGFPNAFHTIVTNHGNLFAGTSTDGGKTFHWGDAINTTNAPNPVTIQLLGSPGKPSYIFGNVMFNASDTVLVQQGETIIDGMIDPAAGGALNIDSSGKLLFAAGDPVNGAAGAVVNTVAIKGNGTLAIELTPDNNPAVLPKLRYPQIQANTVSLGGTLFVGFLPGNYNFTDQVYEDVIHASTSISGNFARVLDNSALLEVTATKEGADEDGGSAVDINVHRVAFGAVAGLSGNQQAVGDAIEKIFGTGNIGTIIPELFALNSSDYQKALNALGGAEFAQLDQSVLWSTRELDRTITDRMDCGANWLAAAQGGSSTQCFVPGKISTWARIDGSWNHDSGDANAPGYSEKQTGIFGGLDYAISSSWFVGIAGGYFSSDMNFDNVSGMGGSSADYSGAQAALYGGYDDGRSYARAIGSYGHYNGTSSRFFGLLNAAPIDPSGSFNASAESFYGEVGRRYALLPQTTVTPFAGISLAHSDVSGFSESPASDPTSLNVGASSGNSLASALGARVEGHWGGWKPEASVAWQHEFDNPVETVTNSFIAAPGTSFTASSSDPGRDWAVVSVGTTYAFTPSSEVTVKYDGFFASGYSASAVVGRWDTRF